MPGDWAAARAKHRLPGEPELVPLFPIPPFTRQQVVRTSSGQQVERPVPCPHKTPLIRGTRLVCAICHKSGMDHLGVMARNPQTDPKPDKKAPTTKSPKLTRKEKRALARDYKLREDSLTERERDYLRGLGVAL